MTRRFISGKKIKLNSMLKLALASSFFIPFVSVRSMAVNVDWSGVYRFEWMELDKTSLDDPKLRKSYILNGLQLSPKIHAADGVDVTAKFNVLTNPAYPDDQTGQPFGAGPSKASGTTSSTGDDSAVGSEKNKSYSLQVSQLYATINQPYGTILLGRAPLHFGLGITHNAGIGPFDHWQDTYDLVSYKFIIGNFSFMPIIAKSYDYSVAQGRDVSNLIWHLDYNNPDTESQISLFHQTKTSSIESNDTPYTGSTPANSNGIPGSGIQGGSSIQQVGIFLSRGFEPVKIKFEAEFQSGNTGIVRNGEDVKANGYGMVLDLDFVNPTSKFNWDLKLGLVSGDNPDSTNYEGFALDRNFDLSMMMFNHPLGKFDIFRSAYQRSPNRMTCSSAPCGTYSTDESLDEESVSNVLFFAPKLNYKFADKWDWQNRFVWAQLQTVVGDGAKDVGFEWDTAFIYKHTENIQWVNEVGFLFPGAAWSGTSSQNYGHGFTYGLNSKFAISF